VQKALRAGCSDTRDELQQITGFMPGCALEVERSTIEATAAALRADPVLQANLRHQYSDVFSAHVNIRGDVESIRQGLAALAAQQRPAEAAP
jgi:hypothetical protein